MAAKRRTRRRKYQKSGPFGTLQARVQGLIGKFSKDAMGLAIFAVGGYLGFSLFTSGQDSLVAVLAGSLAWPVALSLLGIGAVMMLARQPGYWNPEGAVGAELLILSVAALLYINGHEAADWAIPAADEGGGLMGWGAGNVLISLLGQASAALCAGLFGLLGLYLLFRHTPLIFLVARLAFAGRLLARLGRGPSQPPSADHSETTAGELEEVGAYSSPVEGSVDAPLWDGTGPDSSEADSFETDLFEVDSMEPEPLERSIAGRKIQAELEMPADVPARRRSKSAEGVKRSPAADGREASPLKRTRSKAKLPPPTLLDDDADQLRWDVEGMADIIRQTLWDFNIPVEIVNIESGPTITQFGVQPQYIERAGQKRKVRVSLIASVADDLALALAAPAIRIEAPVPGQPYVGIEVPNPEKVMVGLKGILQSRQMASQGGRLPLALGRDTAGRPIVFDLARAPHLLIAGATGSGKSACINGLIVSLLMYHGPESLRFIMVDPKRVELPGYNRIPHLIGKVITDVEQVHGALTWLLLQMDDRYNLFRTHQVRNIAAYNALGRQNKKFEPLPYLVLIVDELADLMMTAPEEIERQLVRLAQMARATGIHLVLATQRPSADVVTGLIKANFPSRIAFAVTSQIDSRVILDSPGAEKLLGQGDLLFLRPDNANVQRVQGSYVNDPEIRGVVDWWKERDRQENPDGPRAKVAPWIGLLDRMDDEDELLADAIDAIRGEKTISASFVQRRLQIGYPRAARLVSLLEKKGVVGANPGGGKGRVVLLKTAAETVDQDGAFAQE